MLLPASAAGLQGTNSGTPGHPIPLIPSSTALQELREVFHEAALAPATRRAYQHGWRVFSGFLKQQGDCHLAALPPEQREEVFCTFVLSLINSFCSSDKLGV